MWKKIPFRNHRTHKQKICTRCRKPVKEMIYGRWLHKSCTNERNREYQQRASRRRARKTGWKSRIVNSPSNPSKVCTKCRKPVDKKFKNRWIHYPCWLRERRRLNFQKRQRDRAKIKLNPLAYRYSCTLCGRNLNRRFRARNGNLVRFHPNCYKERISSRVSLYRKRRQHKLLLETVGRDYPCMEDVYRTGCPRRWVVGGLICMWLLSDCAIRRDDAEWQKIKHKYAKGTI